MTRRLLTGLLFLLLSSLAAAQGNVAHPRLILDSTMLAGLRARATANTPQWRALKTYCDAFIGGKVNYPDEPAYPDRPDIGQAYQGEGYWPALMSEALCYQTLKANSPAAAAPYGAKALDVLMKISMPYPGAHAENPCLDDGYVIRFYGVLMGIGYDWLYDLLTPAQRQQVYTTANSWLNTWETNSCSSFAYGHPQGNYFAGYFHAKAAIALATYGDNPKAPALWDDWQNAQFRTATSNPPHIGVLPYYQQHLAGGGWPEGFGNYGPLATLNMSLPIWEVKTATGVDLVNAASPFAYPVDMGEYAMHFTWPSRDYFDDRDDNHANGDASQPSPGTANTQMFVHLLGAARFWNAPHANALQQYVNEVDAATNGYGLDPWEAFLFRDPNGATAPLSTLPLSYFASGMNAVAARSDWTTGASWMSFRAGPYANNPDAEHELFDQGSLALVRGKTPLLVNGTGWIVHEPNGNTDETRLMADNYGGFDASNIYSGNRTLNNVFYVRRMNGAALVEPFGQSAYTSEEQAVATHVSHYEDGGSYVYVLAEKLEDMYRPVKGGGRAVAAWSRQIVYLRPNRFIVYDRTQKGSADYDQYLAFHFPGAPATAAAPSGTSRVDVSVAGKFAGSMSVVLPASAATTTIAMYPAKPSNKVWQVQVRPADTAVAQRWLTVFDLASSGTAAAQATPVAVDSSNILGVYLAAADENSVVLSSASSAGSPVSGAMSYRIPAAAAHHVLTDLPSNSGYSIAIVVANGQHRVTVTPGGSFRTSTHGVLDFRATADGAVNGSPIDGVCGSDDGKTLSAPPIDLCAAGTPSVVQGSGPWNWSCAGGNGGGSASCSAQKTVVMHTVTATAGPSGTISPSGTQTVADGTVLTFTLTPNNGYVVAGVSGCGIALVNDIWTTQPITGDCTVSTTFTVVYAPVDGTCGEDDGKTLAAPPVNLCILGTPSTVEGSGPWTWTCQGSNDGTSASCSAQKLAVVHVVTATAGAGGEITPSGSQTVADGSTIDFTVTPGAGYVVAGVSGCGIRLVDNIWATEPITADCIVTASFSPIDSPVDGTCGSDDNKTLTAPPVNLCSLGAPSAVLGNGPWSWTCQGSNGGTDAHCSAQKTAVPPFNAAPALDRWAFLAMLLSFIAVLACRRNAR